MHGLLTEAVQLEDVLLVLLPREEMFLVLAALHGSVAHVPSAHLESDGFARWQIDALTKCELFSDFGLKKKPTLSYD